MKILILCTGNSCRSQMAQGILQSFNDKIAVFSAGTNPSEKVHPKAIQVMQELGLNINDYRPKSVGKYLHESFDFVITVCGNAKESCPTFSGEVKKYLHIGFDDPAEVNGTNEEILNGFRNIRNKILKDFYTFYNKNIR